MDPLRAKGLILVVVAGVLYSSAGLFARALHYDAWTILAWRAVYGALFTAVWMLVEERSRIAGAFAFSAWQWISIPLLALGAVCYIFALKVTTVADVMVVYATMPFVTSIVAWFWGRERPSARLLRAGSIAMVGVGVMMAGSFGSGSRVLGIALTMAMNFSFAAMLVGARRVPRSNTGVYLVATVLDALIGFGFAPAEQVTPYDMAVLALFGFCTIGLAMALFMTGAQLIPPAEVGLLGIVDVIIGPALVWAVFAEAPGVPASIGAAVIIAALIWHLWPDFRAGRAGPEPPSPAGAIAPSRIRP